MKKNYQTILTSVCLLALGTAVTTPQAQAATFGDGEGEIAISFPGVVNLTNNVLDFTNTRASSDPNWDNTGDGVGTTTVDKSSPEYLLFGNITVENAGATGIFAGLNGSSIDLRNTEGIIRDIAFFDKTLVSGVTHSGPSVTSQGRNWIKYDANGNDIFGDDGDLTYSFTSITATSTPAVGGLGSRTEYSFEGTFNIVGTTRTLASTFSLFDTTNSIPVDILTLNPADNASEFNNDREVNNLTPGPNDLVRLTFDGKQGAESRGPRPNVPEPFALVGTLVAFGSGLLLKKQRKLS